MGDDPIKKDHLDIERTVDLGASGNLVGSDGQLGVRAKSNLRLMNGLDRLVGNGAEWLNVRIEKGISRRRAEIEAEARMIQASTDFALERIKTDRDFAERAMARHIGTILQGQENREAVAERAVLELEANPPSEEERDTETDHLDPVFLGDFEEGAGRAHTDELRDRWAKVLAAEVRAPGTFSRKALRVVDELDPGVARLFEKLASVAFGDGAPKCLAPTLLDPEERALADADLVVEPGFGQSVKMEKVTEEEGVEYIGFSLSGMAAVFPRSDVTRNLVRDNPELFSGWIGSGSYPGLPMWRFTDAGKALAKLTLHDERSNFARIISKLRQLLPDNHVQTVFYDSKRELWVSTDITSEVRQLEIWPPADLGSDSEGT